MMHEFTKAMMKRADTERFQLAFQKNPQCVVCGKAVPDLATAFLIERNDRLACAGPCTDEALKHVFVFAHSSRKGFRAMRRMLS
jgi:hypothetical protein